MQPALTVKNQTVNKWGAVKAVRNVKLKCHVALNLQEKRRFEASSPTPSLSHRRRVARFVIRPPGKVVQCENHLPKVREM